MFYFSRLRIQNEIGLTQSNKICLGRLDSTQRLNLYFDSKSIFSILKKVSEHHIYLPPSSFSSLITYDPLRGLSTL